MKSKVFIILFLISLNLICEEHLWKIVYHGMQIFAIFEKGIIYFLTFHSGPEIYGLDRSGSQLSSPIVGKDGDLYFFL